MAERKTVVPGLSITYEGLFEADKLYEMILKWFEEHDYETAELKNVQMISEKGRNVDIFLEPNKTISDYARLVIRVIYRLSEINEKEVVIDGKKKKISEGKVDIKLMGFIDTDIEDKWESKPVYFILRQIYDKFIYRGVLAQYEEQLEKDLTQLQKQIKGFLNIERVEK